MGLLDVGVEYLLAAGARRERRVATSVVGGGHDVVRHGDPACEAVDQPHQAWPAVLVAVGVRALYDRHEVGDGDHAGVGSEGGLQDVAAVAIALGHAVGRPRREPPVAALARVEDAAEQRAVVEAREAQPIDAAVDPDERRAAAVSDEAVGADGEIALAALQGHG